MHNFQGDLTDSSAEKEALAIMYANATGLPFSKLNKIFFGYFDPEKIFLDNKNN